jgi:hypothetical protein
MTPRGLIAASNPEEQISQASAADGGRLPVGYEVDEINKPKMATNPPQGPRRPNRTFPQKDADLDPHPHPGLSGIRKWPVKDFENFLIFYLPHEGGVTIVRVLYARQDWWELLGIK